MKKILKPANLAFYFLTLLVFFVAGVYFAGLTGAGKNQGLAGGAIVLGWGVLFGGIAFFASFFIVHYAPQKVIVRLNYVLLLLVVMAYGITHYRFIQKQKRKTQQEDKLEQPVRKPTAPALRHASFHGDASHKF
jgi:hypothetical protein